MKKALREFVLKYELDQLNMLGIDFDLNSTNKTDLLRDEYVKNTLIGSFDYIPLFIDRNLVSIDIGAYVGAYTLKMALYSRRCISIEPTLEQSWLEDFLPENCRFLNIAIGDFNRKQILTSPIYDNKICYALSSLNKEAIFSKEFIEHEVEVRTLDSICDEFLEGERVGFIKIDVENFEKNVVQGGMNLIQKFKPNIMIEIWSYDVKSMNIFFKDIGYRGLFFYNNVLCDIDTFNPEIHASRANDFDIENPQKFDPQLYIDCFYFVPYK